MSAVNPMLTGSIAATAFAGANAARSVTSTAAESASVYEALQPGIPAVGTSRGMANIFRASATGPTFANGPAAAKDKDPTAVAITDALVAGNVEALKAAIPTGVKPQDMITLLKEAATAADTKINAEGIVKQALATHFWSYSINSIYSEENSFNFWGQIARIIIDHLEENPALGQIFWNQLNTAMSGFTDMTFWENANCNLPKRFEESFKGKVRDDMIVAFVEHIIANPRSRCVQWAKENCENMIWNPAVAILKEKLQESEITEEAFTSFVSS